MVWKTSFLLCKYVPNPGAWKLLGSLGYVKCVAPLHQIGFHGNPCAIHDDVIKWKHLPRYWPLVWGIHRSSVNSPHKGQWRGALMFCFIYAWINGWVNNREAGDLRRHRAHYDGIVTLYSTGWYRFVARWKVFLLTTSSCVTQNAQIIVSVTRIRWELWKWCHFHRGPASYNKARYIYILQKWYMNASS